MVSTLSFDEIKVQLTKENIVHINLQSYFLIVLSYRFKHQ